MAELSELLPGRAIDDVVQLESCRFLLRFAEPPFPRVHIAIHPRLSTIHLARGMKAPNVETELAVMLTRELSGRTVLSVTKHRADRIARIAVTGGRELIIELMGKASNLLLLGAEGEILRFARRHGGDFRQPVEGGTYIPPPRSTGWIIDDIDDVTRGALESIAATAGDALATRLVEAIPGMSRHLAREIEHRVRAGEGVWREFEKFREQSSAASGLSPVLYSPVPPESLPESRALTSRNLFASTLALSHASDLAATQAATANEAEEMATACIVRRMLYETVYMSLSTLLRRETRRIETLVEVLRKELDDAGVTGAVDRRRAELILAGMHDARKEGSFVRVVDHYDPEGATVEIPIEPRLGLNENAQRYFKSARRSARTLELAPARLRGLRDRLKMVESAAGQVAAAANRVELETIERGLQEAGIVKAFRKTERAEVGRVAEYVHVREFLTRDGFTVLVGRTAAENDHLTFKVAAGHDLWLHAAGYAGAHVIIRNPKRLQTLPDSTVHEAAAIAAWFSKGNTEKMLDVHVAWRRHVRKGKGMSPGMVMLKRHQTVRVSPALPQASSG